MRLRARCGKAMKKPWSVVTSSVHLMAALNGRRCQGDHEHQPCLGRDPRLSESYSWYMCTTIHNAFACATSIDPPPPPPRLVCSHPMCSRSFSSRSLLNRHFAEHSGVLYTCSFVGCRRTFTRNDRRLRHERLHAPASFSCPRCDYTTSRLDVLRKHFRRMHATCPLRLVRC